MTLYNYLSIHLFTISCFEPFSRHTLYVNLAVLSVYENIGGVDRFAWDGWGGGYVHLLGDGELEVSDDNPISRE